MIPSAGNHSGFNTSNTVRPFGVPTFDPQSTTQSSSGFNLNTNNSSPFQSQQNASTSGFVIDNSGFRFTSGVNPIAQSKQTSSLNTNPTTSIFGKPIIPPGSSVHFNPVQQQDTVVKNGLVQNIATRIQCITCMKVYEDKSFEELREEDRGQGYKPTAVNSFPLPSSPKGLFNQPVTNPFANSLNGFNTPKTGFGPDETSRPTFTWPPKTLPNTGCQGCWNSPISQKTNCFKSALINVTPVTTNSGFVIPPLIPSVAPSTSQVFKKPEAPTGRENAGFTFKFSPLDPLFTTPTGGIRFNSILNNGKNPPKSKSHLPTSTKELSKTEATTGVTYLPLKEVPKLPPFSRKYIEAWFRQLEAIFKLMPEYTDYERCNLITASLDLKTLDLIKDKILDDGITYEKYREILSKLPTNEKIAQAPQADGNSVSKDKLEQRIKDLEKKLADFIDNNPLEQRLTALEEKMNNLTMSVSSDECINELKKKIDDSGVLNTSVEQRINALEEQVKSSIDSPSFKAVLSGLKNKRKSLKERIKKNDKLPRESIFDNSPLGLGKITNPPSLQLLNSYIDSNSGTGQCRSNEIEDIYRKKMITLEKELNKITTNEQEQLENDEPDVVTKDEKRKRWVLECLTQSTDNTLNVTMEHRIIALEEKAKNTKELQDKFDGTLALNQSLENRLATVEETVKNFAPTEDINKRVLQLEVDMKNTASKVTLDEFIEVSNEKIKELTDDVAGVETYVAEMESKIVELIFK